MWFLQQPALHLHLPWWTGVRIIRHKHTHTWEKEREGLNTMKHFILKDWTGVTLSSFMQCVCSCNHTHLPPTFLPPAHPRRRHSDNPETIAKASSHSITVVYSVSVCLRFHGPIARYLVVVFLCHFHDMTVCNKQKAGGRKLRWQHGMQEYTRHLQLSSYK